MLHCRLLGSPDLTDGTGRRLEAVLNQPKRFALLAYLAVEARGAPVQRDKLAALFWEELDQERARHALRQALHVLRRDLGDDAVGGTGEGVSVDPARLMCDVPDFVALLRDGHAEQGLALYRGDFADAFHVSDAPAFEAWADRKRADLRAAAVDAAMSLGRTSRERGDAKSAARWLRNALTLAPTNERAARELLSVLDQHGDRAQAIAAYEEFAARLKNEYELDPSAETQALIEQIRTRPQTRASIVARVASAARRWSGGTRDVAHRELAHSRHRWRLGALAAGALLVLVSVAAIAWNRRSQPSALNTQPSSAEPSVGVLPFLAIGPDSDATYIADGITEGLITALSKVPSLRVPARTSSFVFKGQQKSVGDIARQLGVASVLEGSVQRSGKRARITAQLIDASTGYHKWSETYDRELSDLFAVQDEIARAIVGALELRLVGQRPATLHYVERATGSPQAYDAYLKGLYFWNQRGADGIRKAIDHFSAAVAIDRSYAMAYAGLANAYSHAPSFDVMPPDTAFPRASEAAKRALQLDSTLADAHAALGYIRMLWERDWPGAERELRRAIELNAGYATAWQWLRLYLLAVGRNDEAVAAAQRSARLDPLSISIQAALGDTYTYVGRPREALAPFQSALELDPRYSRAYTGVCEAEYKLGRMSEAVAACERAVEHGPTNSRYAADLGFVSARAGQRRRADSILASLRATARLRYVPSYSFATLHSGLGQPDSAFYWMNRAVDERDNFTMFFAMAPQFEPLRADPRFTRTLARMGLSR
jgi:serine/threonine-protein kinase